MSVQYMSFPCATAQNIAPATTRAVVGDRHTDVQFRVLAGDESRRQSGREIPVLEIPHVSGEVLYLTWTNLRAIIAVMESAASDS